MIILGFHNMGNAGLNIYVDGFLRNHWFLFNLEFFGLRFAFILTGWDMDKIELVEGFF